MFVLELSEQEIVSPMTSGTFKMLFFEGFSVSMCPSGHFCQAATCLQYNIIKILMMTETIVTLLIYAYK